LHYMPQRPVIDPIGSDACVNVPALICRTTENFLLDSTSPIRRFTSAAHSLNGQLMGTGSEELVRRMNTESRIGDLPREITLELNTSRTTSPVYWPGKTAKIDRTELTADIATKLFADLGGADDIRLTLAGVGDPLNAVTLFDIIAMARSAGMHAIHVETDLAVADESLAARLAAADVDVVSVYLPALSPATYAAVMGADLMLRVLNNIKVFVTERARRSSGVPVVVPTFVKLAANLAEMDAWYDQWLSAVGAAAIVGPADASLALADMSPVKRKSCSRIARGISVLSDGQIVSCERDVTRRQTMGRVGETSISEIWAKRFGQLREDHAAGAFAKHPVCAGCRAWHLAA
jgi:radical SAM protein with 4Fe4S-binding SPASM domain